MSVGRGNSPGTHASLRANANAMRVAAEPRWNRVLQLWAAGRTSNQIAAATFIPRNSVCRIVRQARKQGDPRAVERGAPSVLRAGRIARGLPA